MRAVLLSMLLSLLGCGAEAPPRPGVYSESLDFAAVEPALPALARRGLDLYQVLEPAHIGDPALRHLLQRCAEEGVGVRAWLVLPRAEGLWPNEQNLAPFGAALADLLRWIREERLPVRWITFDLEPSWSFTQELMALARDRASPTRIPDVLALLRRHHDPAMFEKSQAALGALVDAVHGAGLRAHAVTYPMIIDDAEDGDADIEDAFDIPVRGLPWDEVSLMVYRSTWQAFASAPLSPALLSAYGQGVREQFGERGGLDLGVVGADPITGAAGYQDPGALAVDVGAARAAGVERLHLYSLESARALPDLDGWLGFAAAPMTALPPPDPGLEQFRSLFTVLDRIVAAPAGGR